VPLNWSGTGTIVDPFVATANGIQVLSITINNQGDYEVIQNHSLDHSLTGADKITITIPILDGGLAHDVLELEVVDGVPTATKNETANLTQTVHQNGVDLVISTPQTYRGSAVESFGGDAEGAHVSKVTIEGVNFTYDGTTVGTPSFTGSNIVTSHTVTDGSGTSLVVTTVRGETVTVNLNTGNYTVEVTGQGLAVNEAPEANIATSGGLLGIIDANILDVIDLSKNQLFSVSDANDNLSSVTVNYSTELGGYISSLVPALITSLKGNLLTLPLGLLLEALPVTELVDFLVDNNLVNSIGGGVNLLINGRVNLVYDAALANELGLTVTGGTGSQVNQVNTATLQITSANGKPVDAQVLNEFLGTVRLGSSTAGLLDLLATNAQLASKLQLDVTDAQGATDSAESTGLLDLSLVAPSDQNMSKVIVKGTGDDNTLDQSTAAQAVRIYGLDGNDTIKGSNYADIIRGGTGTDT
ncbi:MAG: hypothetical protein RSB25_19985, partial [Acinetobacter sp.]